jgi:hypothetical protein
MHHPIAHPLVHKLSVPNAPIARGTQEQASVCRTTVHVKQRQPSQHALPQYVFGIRICFNVSTRCQKSYRAILVQHGPTTHYPIQPVNSMVVLWIQQV